MKKKQNLILTLLLVILSFSASNAQNFVNETLARKIGSNFVSSNSSRSNTKLDLIHTISDFDSQANLYIFNIEGGGFVIVSAIKETKPILAYSFNNSFGGEIPATASYFINNYNNTINYIKETELPYDESCMRLWDELENNDIKNRTTAVVNPLIQTQWNQDCYYNEYAPFDNYGPCNRAYAGCVACAMSQVMKYWNYPETGKGSHDYTHSKYGNLSADFGSTAYKWDEMPNEIWSHNDAIATLMYQCGVSVNMNYGPDGSGAQSKDVETAMRSYFGYSAAKYVERSSLQDDEWIALLKSELDKKQPMYFSGTGEPGGHAIVCDGYDSNDYFHFNMGWSGMSDGFYSIDDACGFYKNQAVVMNIIPLPINADENNIIYVAADGTGDGSSWENATSKLEYATAIASDGNTQIWVKSGTYYGDISDENGAICFYAKNRIYGGFSGNENADFDISQRDLESNPTILDGENQRRVLYQNDHFSSSTYSIIDGFTIQNGYSGSGGALLLSSNSRFYNCKFINNSTNGQGGAVYTTSPLNNSTLNIFENCFFENNSASMGGAIFDINGLTLSRCMFIENSATTKGGAYYVFTNKKPKLVNCVFAQNSAADGGAIYNRGQMTMTNCNIVRNEAQNSIGGMYNENKYSKFFNSVFWNNTANGVANQIEGELQLFNCAVEGDHEGTNIVKISADNSGNDSQNYPLFRNPDINDYYIMDGSILINAGDKTYDNVSEKDINNDIRIVKGQVDIGAYENQTGASIIETNDNTLLIYPNPAKDHINIIGEINLTIDIYNSLGQKIYSEECENSTTIETSEWTSGIYFVKINDKIYKIVK
ncbi:MAG: C10 family peptidase [Bacteroidales bacterium]|nr:C10 family peptidase [Bacteroidales bacterium]